MTSEDTSKKNKRLAFWLGLLAIMIAVLSYRFWQNLSLIVDAQS